MIAGDPHQGGATWAVLQYVLGFRRLGHDVVFVEPVKRERVPAGGLQESVSARYFRDIVRDFGLGAAALVACGTRETVGLGYAELAERTRRADVLVNVSGMLAEPELF